MFERENEIERFKNASPEACTIKLADILDNGKCFLRSGDKAATATYMREKKLLIPVLCAGDSNLYNMANDMICDYYKTMAVFQ